MPSGRTLFALTSILLLSLGVVACGGGGDGETETAGYDAEEWAWLQQTKTDLDAKRAQLAEMAAAETEGGDDAEATEEDGGGEDGATEDGATEGDGAETAEALPSAEDIQAEINKLGEEYNTRLANFINSQEMYEGEPLTEVQRAAFDMKGDEDILIAQEYIDAAGDYQRAIDIYIQSLAFDPDNEKIQAAKAEAETLRYMTEERFGAVDKGMTEAEVQAALGTPMRMNVREFEEGLLGWFYPKEAPNTAAGVFFQEKDGAMEVYKVDFNAVEAPTEEEQG